MAIFNKAKTFSAVALCATALALPSMASARDTYCHSKNDDAQIIGGLIGAVAGGLIGSEVAGRGDGTEGAVIGAILGGGAGAAIGDSSVKCGGKYDRTTRTYRPVPSRTFVEPVRVQPVAHHGGGYNRGYTTRGHYDRGFTRLDRIERRIDNLRLERRDLKNRRGYGNARWIERRLSEIAYELDSLKRDRKRLKKRQYDSRRDYRGYRDTGYSQRGHYHGGSNTLCYSGH